jgi:hypothetical protein
MKELDLSSLEEGEKNPYHPIRLRKDLDDALRHVKTVERLFWRGLVPLVVAVIGGVAVALVSRSLNRVPPAAPVSSSSERMGVDRVEEPPKP